MQLSNGLSDPIGLWLGHLMFDAVFCVIAASLIVIVFAAASSHFTGLGFFVSALHYLPNTWTESSLYNQWVVLVLYGITGALFSYCISLIVSSPLAAFAASAAYGVIMFVVS